MVGRDVLPQSEAPVGDLQCAATANFDGPASVSALKSRGPMMRPAPMAEEKERQVGVGLIGAGMIGQVAHLSNFVENTDCRVVALAELRPELGRLAAAKFGVPKVYGSHRELITDPAVDAVVVVTRRAATGPIVLEALSAGKHVLSEKPMAHSVEQASRLVEAAAKRDLRYAVGFMKRHDAGTAEARSVIRQARVGSSLGRILLVRAYCYGGEFVCATDGYVMTDEERPEGLELWPVSPDWLPDRYSADYAWFLNVYVHDINLLRYLFDEPMAVRAVDFSRGNGRVVVLDAGRFPVVLELAESAGHEWREGVEVIFERGRVELAFGSPMLRNQPARVTVYRAGEAAEQRVVEWSWSFRRQADAFIRDIRNAAAPLASGADSIEDMRLIEEIWRCHLSGEASSKALEGTRHLGDA